VVNIVGNRSDVVVGWLDMSVVTTESVVGVAVVVPVAVVVKGCQTGA
jgi:hypothetical protein